MQFDGTSVTRKVWGGNAWIEEFETSGPSGKVEGLTLRLYPPQAHQWRLYWASSKDGLLGQPTVGEFKEGAGNFTIRKTTTAGRFWCATSGQKSRRTPAHFEQSFSIDGGKTWEVNWITDQVRVAQANGAPSSDHGSQ